MDRMMNGHTYACAHTHTHTCAQAHACEHALAYKHTYTHTWTDTIMTATGDNEICLKIIPKYAIL